MITTDGKTAGQRPTRNTTGGNERTILVPGRNCRDILPVAQSGILIDGQDYYLSFYRNAREADRYILISGWQFDTEVTLLRGSCAAHYGESAPFLSFLNSLCARKPRLRIYILAWEYNFFFLNEREWFQERIVKSRSNGQLRFLADGRHAVAGSHHQKFAVIDGKIAFAGGADICADRWDDRRHLPVNPLRVNPGNRLHGPYHEIQSYVTGPAVKVLTAIFRERWEKAGGGPISLPESADPPCPVEEGLPIRAGRVAISRTLPRMFFPRQEPVDEIRHLYLDAIAAARSHIYIENQYFSSRSIHDALARKMTGAGPRLQIVIILPKDQNAFSEQISVGVEQSRILRSLTRIASAQGHSLGIYYTAPLSGEGMRCPVYIHSKMMIVDDSFLTVGSANFTNRSQRIDAELNLSWEARAGEGEAIRSIRRIRVALLAEHTGLSGPGHVRRMTRPSGLVPFLDGLADGNPSRLCKHPMTTRYGNNVLVRLLPTFLIDPEKQLFEENLYQLGKRLSTLIARSRTWLAARFQKPKT